MAHYTVTLKGVSGDLKTETVQADQFIVDGTGYNFTKQGAVVAPGQRANSLEPVAHFTKDSAVSVRPATPDEVEEFTKENTPRQPKAAADHPHASK
jgi:hypothetical protein